MAKVKLTDTRIKNEPLTDNAKMIYDEDVTNLYIRISKTKKVFYYRYSFNGKYNQVKLGEYPFLSLKEARSKSIDVYKKILNDQDPKGKDRNKKMIFADVMEKYKKHHISTLRQSTQDVYQFIINNLPDSDFYNLDIKKINRFHISEYIISKKDENSSVHASLQLRNFLSGFFNWSIQMGYVETNPVTHAINFKKPPPRQRFYDEDEIRKIYKALPLANTPLSDIIHFLFMTGKRKGETTKLKYEWIDWKKRLITIPSTVTKNKSKDVVYLNDSAMEIIKRRQEKWDSPYIFNKENREQHEPITYLHNQIRTFRKLCGIEDFRLQDIRRTVSTHCSKIGINQRIKDLILNNADASKIQLTYDVHDYMKEKKEAILKLEKRIEEIINEKKDKK